jgi:hypothetical protein
MNKMKEPCNFDSFLDNIEKDNLSFIEESLKNKDFNPVKYCNEAFKTAIKKGSNNSFWALLNDSRVNQIFDDNQPLYLAYKYDNLTAFTMLIGDKVVMQSLTNEWVEENIKYEKYKKIALNGISIYNF